MFAFVAREARRSDRLKRSPVRKTNSSEEVAGQERELFHERPMVVSIQSLGMPLNKNCYIRMRGLAHAHATPYDFNSREARRGLGSRGKDLRKRRTGGARGERRLVHSKRLVEEGHLERDKLDRCDASVSGEADRGGRRRAAELNFWLISKTA